MSVNQAVNLNLSTDIVPPVLKMVQNDSNSRYIVASLWDGASAYDVGSASVMLRFTKPDGTGGMYDADEVGNVVDVDGNVVTIPVAAQVLTVAGDVFAQVDIYGSSNSKLASFAFKIEVAASVYPDAQIISSDYYNVLTDTIANAVTAAQNAAASATAAAQSAAEAATAAEGAVKYNAPQSLTSAQKAQARTNIGAPAPYTAGGGIAISGSVISTKAYPCNPNLLRNGTFPAGCIVNQRGKTSYAGTGYGVDMWYTTGATLSVDVTAEGVKLYKNAASANPAWAQALETDAVVGQTVTVSMLYKGNGEGASLRVAQSGGIVTLANVSDWTLVQKTFVVEKWSIGTLTDRIIVAIQCFESMAANQGLYIKGIKLELGEQQTLAHQENGAWVLNEIPDYGEELTKCMCYLQVIATPYDTSGNGVAIGYANNTVDLWVPIPLAVPMRISPTPTIPTGGVSLFKVGKTSSALKDVSKVTGGWAMQTGGACTMRSLIFMSSGLTAGETYTLFMKDGAQIVFSAEL